MKILHCADVHLGKKPFGTREFTRIRYEDFFRAFSDIAEIAIQKQVDVVVIAGDLFDKREITPDILERSEAVFRRLQKQKIEILLIEGNHDIINGDDTVNSWHDYLGRKDYARYGSYRIQNGRYVFDKIRIGEINFYPVGYPGFAVDEVLTALGDELDPFEKNYVIVHTAVDGSDFLPGLVATETLWKLQEKVLYIAGGHFHNHSHYPQKNPFFFVPGSPEYWDVKKDKSNRKGLLLLDTDTRETEFIETKPRKRIRSTFVAKKSDEAENLSDFSKFAEELEMTGEELVLLEFRLSGHAYVNTQELEEILEQKGALKAYVTAVYGGENAEVAEISGDEYSIQTLERNIMETWKDFRSGENLALYLQKLKEDQMEGRREDFLELFEKMLEEELS